MHSVIFSLHFALGFIKKTVQVLGVGLGSRCWGFFASQWKVLKSYFLTSPHNLVWEKQLTSTQSWSEIVISISQYLKVCNDWKARETNTKLHTNLEISKFNSDSSATLKPRFYVVFYPLTSVTLIILAIFRWETSQRNQQPWWQQL